MLNDVKCPSNQLCSVQMVENFAETNISGDVPTLSCSSRDASSTDNHGTAAVTCTDYDNSAAFSSPITNPYECTVDADCKLTDNTYTICKCGFDGKAYCTPPLNSTLFDFVGENCASNNGVINDTSLEAYAILLLDYYPYVYNVPSCGENILEVSSLLAQDYTGVNLITEDNSNAVWLSVTLGFVLQVLA
jgi:hypothetical protein